VYRLDLSAVPEGGPYKISVKGYGCSYLFGVGSDFSKRLGYVSFRSLYHQRCGCPIIEPYAWNIKKKPCHTIIYKTNAPINEANLTVQGTEPTFIAYGGYHDAGDADRRTHHMDVPATLLTTYEAFKDLFTDDQFNIPDIFDANYNIVGKGNKIPDIIDEAEWGTYSGNTCRKRTDRFTGELKHSVTPLSIHMIMMTSFSARKSPTPGAQVSELGFHAPCKNNKTIQRKTFGRIIQTRGTGIQSRW